MKRGRRKESGIAQRWDAGPTWTRTRSALGNVKDTSWCAARLIKLARRAMPREQLVEEGGGGAGGGECASG